MYNKSGREEEEEGEEESSIYLSTICTSLGILPSLHLPLSHYCSTSTTIAT
jgi:hypothetical protein